MHMSINDITFRCGRQLPGRDSNRQSSDLKFAVISSTAEVFMRLALLKKDNGTLIRSEYRARIKWEYKS